MSHLNFPSMNVSLLLPHFTLCCLTKQGQLLRLDNLSYSLKITFKHVPVFELFLICLFNVCVNILSKETRGVSRRNELND